MTDEVLREAVDVLRRHALVSKPLSTDAELSVTALLVQILREDVHLSDAARTALLYTVWHRLNVVQRSQLKQLLFHGPVFDGAVLSKQARTELISSGLATRCCVHGELGYTAATYVALSVYKTQTTGEKTA